MSTSVIAGGTDTLFFYKWFILLFKHLLLTAVGISAGPAGL